MRGICMQKINKLCRVYGIGKTDKYGRRYIHYFYVDKKWDKPKYAKMIEDYRVMEPDAKKYAEEIVNEMFTTEEVELLKVYFEQEEPEMELFVQEEALPIPTKHLHPDGELSLWVCTFKVLADSVRKDSTAIVNIKNNGLPFKVAGIRAYG